MQFLLYYQAMIPFNEIDEKLATIGKNRKWLSDASGRSENSIRAALAPNATPERRSKLLQRALTEAIEREESNQFPKKLSVPPGYSEIFLNDETLDLADKASRLVGADSLASFCREVIQSEAKRIVAESAQKITSIAAKDEVVSSQEYHFYGSVAAGQPVESEVNDIIIVHSVLNPANHIVYEVNGGSGGKQYPDGSRWLCEIFPGETRTARKNTPAVFRDSQGTYLKIWDGKRFKSVDPNFPDVQPDETLQLVGYPIEMID